MLKIVFAAALAFASLGTLSVVPVHAGDYGCDDGKQRADNGWGNGADSTNNGSFSGGTASSKSVNGYGSGPGPDKFSTR